MIQSLVLDALRRNPYPVFSAMRRVAPVVHLPQPGLWMLFDHASVKRALHDPALFSSRAAPPGGAPLDWLIFQDPPRHTKLRALIMRTFTPRAVAELEPGIERIVHGLIDEVAGRGSMDLVTEFAERLPNLVIVAMLGMPSEDAGRVTRWGEAIIGLGDTVVGGERAAAAARVYRAAVDEMRPYLAALLEERRTSPRDDLLTRLVESEIDGERLSQDDIFSFFQLLLLAGTETTTNLIANAVVTLLEHPAQLERLRARPDLLPATIEEVLRYRTPVQIVFRTTTTDVELRGKRIPKGALVLLFVGSANRDAGQFADASRFDIDRVPQPHVAFGHGIHFCVGAALARLEARVALAALFDRLPGLRRASRERWAPRTGINVLGPRSLPVIF